MIRNYETKDLDRIMTLWLESNIQAHNFIDQSYWEGAYKKVRKMLPKADIFIYEEENKILGFLGLMDFTIAGIFIDSDHRSKGIGKQLLDWVKMISPTLELQVYENNEAAHAFYLREGFGEESKSVDPQTNESEIAMKWPHKKI